MKPHFLCSDNTEDLLQSSVSQCSSRLGVTSLSSVPPELALIVLHRTLILTIRDGGWPSKNSRMVIACCTLAASWSPCLSWFSITPLVRCFPIADPSPLAA